MLKARDVTFARTGKDLVLPRLPGEPPPQQAFLDEEIGEPIALRPTAKLGPSVISDDSCGADGRVYGDHAALRDSAA